MGCHKTIGQVVLPVFYDVDPSEVRHQTGIFGKSFQSLLNRISKVKEEGMLPAQWIWRGPVHKERIWREAFKEAAGLAGYVVPNFR